MMKKFKLLILLVFLVLTSCVNVKDVRYLQPNENLVLNSEGLISYDNMPKYRVTKHDILKLNIITTPKGDAAQFYSSLHAQQGNSGGDGSSFYFNGLRIDEKGEIYILGIGKIKAEGRTIEEIQTDIQNRVNENFLPKNQKLDFF